MDITTLPESIDTLIVGAGHAGLTMSALLTEAGREHLLLERRATLGGGWQDRWDAFQLVTPNWSASFHGWALDGPDPDAFMPRDAIVERVAHYAEVVGAPVARETEVRRVTSLPDRRFRVETSRGDLTADRVVVAAGSFHAPRIPAFAAAISPRVAQVHSHHYRNEAALPPGAVLLVGSGQSGVQLAEELFEAGRSVYLSVGSAGRIPRRYRGRDCFVWLARIAQDGAPYGLGLPTVDKLPDPRMRFDGNPHVSGHGGGHDTNLRRFAAEGMTLVGHLQAADGERLTFAPDLAANLARADSFFDDRFRGLIDGYIERAGVEAPPDDREPFDLEPPQVAELDLAEAGISTILWTGGYSMDFGWIDAPIFDDRGYPQQERGVSPVPGLSFLGLLWQHSQISSTLLGVAADARYLVERMDQGRRPAA
jgi:putative flavoprotein involved in K+ transport